MVAGFALIYTMLMIKILICIFGISGISNIITKTLCLIMLVDTILGFLMAL